MTDQWNPNNPNPRWTGSAGQPGSVPSPVGRPPAFAWLGWKTEPFITVGNSFCKLSGVSADVHWWLRDQLVILTESAKMQAEGWAPPATGELERQWDGKIRLYEVLGNGDEGRFATGLIEQVRFLLNSRGIGADLQDDRRKPVQGVPESDTAGEPLRDYQIAAVDAAEAAGRGVWVMPPRAGKTRCAIELCRRLALPTVYLAPTKNIVSQTVRAFDRHLGKNYAVAHVGSAWKDVAHVPVIVMTYATALELPDAFWKTREVLLVDEVHHAAADGFQKLNKRIDHIFYRFGMSGTYFRSNGDDLAMHAFLSGVLYQVSSQFLVDNGYLVPASVALIPVPEGERVRGSNHHEIVDAGIATHEFRQQAAAWATATMQSRGKKVVVLVSTKKQGDDLVRRCRELIPDNAAGTEFRAVEFVSTARPAQVCEKIIRAFAESDEVKVLIGTSMIGEGTDLPPADCLVYAYGGKAEVGHRQSIYRVCTKAPGKRRAFIVDFADRHHRTLIEHAVDRSMHYLDEPTFSTTVLDRLDYLPGWLDHFGRF